MPAQTSSPKVAYYVVGDTAPDYSVFLEDGAGNRINLAGATVTIDIAYARWSYYYGNQDKLVSAGAVTVDPDQSEAGNRGLVHWTPLPGDLSLVGTFYARFKVTYGGGGVQSIPPDTYLPIIVREEVGG